MAGNFCSKTSIIFVSMPMRDVSKPISESIFSSKLGAGSESCVLVASVYVSPCGWMFADVVSIVVG